MDPEMLARLVFCFENNPEREDGHISGAQDSIGIWLVKIFKEVFKTIIHEDKNAIVHELSL